MLPEIDDIVDPVQFVFLLVEKVERDESLSLLAEATKECFIKGLV